MAPSPQKIREVLLQILVGYDFVPDSPEEEVKDFISSTQEVSKGVARAAYEIRIALLQHLDFIDLSIKQCAQQAYDWDRIPVVERNILRIGVYELCYVSTVPPKVVIAEGIRLSRKFSTKEAANFVNAILDRVYKERLPSHIEKANDSREEECHDAAG